VRPCRLNISFAEAIRGPRNLIVGTPAMIGDAMQHLFEAEACDGFVRTPTISPVMREEFARMLTPELQRLNGGKLPPRSPSLKKNGQGNDRSRRAASGEAPRHSPIDRSAPVVDNGAAAFGHRGIKEVCPDCGRGLDPENQYEERRHQRAAANARQSD
jgi:hypothetical protein